MSRIAILALFGFSIAQAAIEPRSLSALEAKVQGSQFVAKLANGYHFNDKAPNSVQLDGQVIQPSQFKKNKLVFNLTGQKFESGLAKLYVCDDAVTFCEILTKEFKGVGRSMVAIGSTRPVEKKGGTNEFGFIQDDFGKASGLAKARKKNLLIDVSARWCPGCIRFDTETFSTKEFKDATADFVKLKLDVDKFQNLTYTKRFEVKAIPTLIVLSPEGELRGRLVDFQAIARVKSFLAGTSNGSWSDSELDSLSQKVDLAAATAKTDEKNQSEYLALLRKAIESHPQTIHSLLWRTQLAEVLGAKNPEVAEVLQKGVELADKLIADPKLIELSRNSDLIGEFTGFEKLLVATSKAELLASVHPDSEAELQAWKESARIGREIKIPVVRKGPALRYYLVLISAQEFKEAEQYLDQLIGNDPRNLDLQRRKMKLLNATKRPALAEKIGEKILALAVGRNQFWVAEALAKAYLDQNKKAEAKKLLQAFLARNEMTADNMKSSKKTLADYLEQANKN